MAKILVLYDSWMRENAEQMWRDAFNRAMGTEIDSHDFIFAENKEGPYEWSTNIIDNVKEAYGNPEYIKKKIVDCEAVVSGYAPITKEIMNASSKLKIIGISRGGPVNADQKAATEKGIYVLNAVGRNAESVADQTMGFVLSESRHIARHNMAVKTGEYFEKLGSIGRSGYLDSLNWMELNEKTLGLIGFGQVGVRVAKRALAFGMKVNVYDPYVDVKVLEDAGCSGCDLDTVLCESDFISIHSKLTPETKHMINKATMKKMKKTAVIINTARGSIINEDDLYEALKNKTIASAALDVFEEDPIKPDNKLIELYNITITPHTAGRSPETEMRGYRQIAVQVAKHLRGEPIDNIHIANKKILEKTG